ncbi:HepT-like ribonuclease domain-containing protein [Crocosphaera sp.]|uniref:HepT-like ribonuclease domain-containing protein n=1 Tax=Crocosphaera sp. TaxID=2729996 RepID=UPI003F28C6D7
MKDDHIYLADILERIKRIESYTKDGQETFYTSLLIQDGVIRCFEVIGEAVKQLSPEIREKYSNITWRKIAGFRDILIHNYMGIDLDEVWGVIENFLPTLKQNIIAIMENEQE